MNATVTVLPTKAEADKYAAERKLIAAVLGQEEGTELREGIVKLQAMYAEARKLAREAQIAACRANDMIEECSRFAYDLVAPAEPLHGVLLDAFDHGGFWWHPSAAEVAGWNIGEGAKEIARLEAETPAE